MLTYTRKSATVTTVFLENKAIGEIHQCDGGFQYTPKGKKHGSSWSGEVMASESEVRRSLELPDDDE